MDDRRERTKMDGGARLFSGRFFSPKELVTVQALVSDLQYLSITEISRTICELFAWKRRSGRLKDLECRRMLRVLEANGFLHLPYAKPTNTRAQEYSKRLTNTSDTNILDAVQEDLTDIGNIQVRYVRPHDQRRNREWRDYVEKYHYLGYRLPVGAQIRYFAFGDRNPRKVLACLQWSSPAWRVAPRDRWIEWSDEARRRNLHLVVNNSRFLILPWAHLKGLASKILSACSHRLPADWRRRFGSSPVLVETFVDASRYRGTCYAAAGWQLVGQTAGRGRSDRCHQTPGSPKHVYLLPLVPNAKEVLKS
jgi:hypothetical protein